MVYYINVRNDGRVGHPWRTRRDAEIYGGNVVAYRIKVTLKPKVAT